MTTEIDPSARVAYLGPRGTYSHAALQKFFGNDQSSLPVDEIQTVFAKVVEGACGYGLVPVENSTEGSITRTLDCFAEYDLKICGEVLLRIEHCLLIGEQTKASQVRRIVSHPQSFGQCRQWLSSNCFGVARESVSSNGEAAQLAASEAGVAAIAGKSAARIYGLEVLAEKIEDVHDNTTRFMIIAKEMLRGATGRDKSSIVISTRNEPGALFKALEPFKNHGVNLTRLESRPSRKEVWSYSFFLDLEGHCEDRNVKAALAELQGHALDFKVLGSCPAAT